MTEKLLEINNLHVEYRTDEGNVFAINGLDLSLDFGETLGLVGETGAGKTTTALSIMRLLPDKVGIITSGKIKLDGIDIIRATEGDMRLIRSNIVSMIFQDPMSSLNPLLKIGDQILEVLHLHKNKESKADLDSEVDRILELSGIPPTRKDEYPHQFSGGMKQRVVIAIALACRPKLILADEPTTALDVTIQAQILAMIAELKEKLNTAMILITHDLGIVAQNCEKVAVMYAGEIIESGTVEHIFKSENHHPYTLGLFGAIPDLNTTARRLNPIDGLMPDPTIKLEWCRFSSRCPHCFKRCEQNNPGMIELEAGHNIRCHLFGGR